MTKFEAFKIIFSKFDVDTMVKIYNLCNPFDKIYKIDHWNFKKMLNDISEHQIYKMLTTPEYKSWFTILNDEKYYYNNEEIIEYILDEDNISYIFYNKDIWTKYVNQEDIEFLIQNDAVNLLTNHFRYISKNIIEHYVYELEKWECDKNIKYNISKFENLYEEIKNSAKNTRNVFYSGSQISIAESEEEALIDLMSEYNLLGYIKIDL